MSLSDLLTSGAHVAYVTFPASGASLRLNELVARGERIFSAATDDCAVGAILTNDEPSVRLVMGAVVAGATLVSLPLPGRAADPLRYTAWLQSVMARQGIERVVARDDVAFMLESVEIPTVSHTRLGGRSGLFCAGAGDFRLVQFSSGATGEPKPVLMDAEALKVNLRAILDRVTPGEGDVTVSWLPLSHDMGLVGMLMASLAAVEPGWRSGGEIALMEPEGFLRRPHDWLRLISERGGTFTAAPDFGYRLAARSLAAGADLTSIRTAIVGGEVVRPSTLSSFEDRFAGSGWSSTAFAPAYGMAEIGVAAAITPPNEPWRRARMGATELALSGPPLRGYSIEVDPVTLALSIGIPVPAGDGGRSSSPIPIVTGDIGFLNDDGWLAVMGRIDDIIVAHGRNLDAESIQEAVGQVKGVRSGRVTAAGLPSGEWLVVSEFESGFGDTKALRNQIRRAVVGVVDAAPDHVVLLPSGRLPMTSSGKSQRFEVANRWIEGRLR